MSTRKPKNNSSSKPEPEDDDVSSDGRSLNYFAALSADATKKKHKTVEELFEYVNQMTIAEARQGLVKEFARIATDDDAMMELADNNGRVDLLTDITEALEHLALVTQTIAQKLLK